MRKEEEMPDFTIPQISKFNFGKWLCLNLPPRASLYQRAIAYVNHRAFSSQTPARTHLIYNGFLIKIGI